MYAILAGALAPPAARSADLVFTGYARDLETRSVLYVESHFVRNVGQKGESRVVLYRCANGTQTFARKELTYGEVREEPEFSFVDGRSGYTEGLRRTASGPVVFQRDAAGAPVREAAVPSNVVIVSDAGFDEFVRKHWAELEAGRTVRFPFLIPSRLDFLTFKVKKHREEPIEGAAHLGDPPEPLRRDRLVPALHRGQLPQERPGADALQGAHQHPQRRG